MNDSLGQIAIDAIEVVKMRQEINDLRGQVSSWKDDYARKVCGNEPDDDGIMAELFADRARLAARVKELEVERDALTAKLAQEACDWAEADTAIRNAARPHLHVLAVDGDPAGVPSAADVVVALAARCAELEAKGAAK